MRRQKPNNMIEKIISGGQSGVDRAALDVAIKFGISHGGWCPLGRKSEVGLIPAFYLLKETTTEDYSERTILNIKDSDGTLIFLPDRETLVTDGTALTKNKAEEMNKPLLIIFLSDKPKIENVVTWLKNNNIKILNIAGLRESQSLGIYQKTKLFLESFLRLPEIIAENDF
jgi:hypothetical protein